MNTANQECSSLMSAKRYAQGARKIATIKNIRFHAQVFIAKAFIWNKIMGEQVAILQLKFNI